MLLQLLALYADPESHKSQCTVLQTDGRIDGRHHSVNN